MILSFDVAGQVHVPWLVWLQLARLNPPHAFVPAPGQAQADALVLELCPQNDVPAGRALDVAAHRRPMRTRATTIRSPVNSQ